MPIGLAVVEEPKRILIVGLGGATIPNFLHKHYPRTTIDVVDIDPDVVVVAKKFFGFKDDPTMRAHVADGRKFVEESRDRYDIIFLDAYGRDNIPYHLATREFLQAARARYRPRASWSGTSGATLRTRFTTRWSGPTRRCSAICTSWTCRAPATGS